MSVGYCLFMLAASGSVLPTGSAAPTQQAYVKASNSDAGDIFGHSVAVSGDTMVIGAPAESSSAMGINGNQNDNEAGGAGAAYVFVLNGTNWTQQAYLKASNTDANDSFGYSVAVAGDIVAVGAIGEDSAATGVNGDQNDNSASSAGAVYIFARNGSTWSQQAYLKASDAGGSFGAAVAISGDTLVVGTEGAEAAFVFVRNGTNWSQQAWLQASNIESGNFDFFGKAVAISGDTVVVGARWEASNSTGVNGDQSNNDALESGAAYIFVRNGTNWSQQAYLKASNTGWGYEFGRSVAVWGDTAVIGSPYEASSATGINGNQLDTHARHSGAAYVFVRNATNWSQQAYIKASNTGGGDAFGKSVSLSGRTLVIGAVGESSNAIGVNGSQDNDNALASGAAYVFVCSGSNWNQQAYLKASNTGAFDAFGNAVAVSGKTVVVGARGEASNATGIDGNQSDNSLSYAGASYVFTDLGIGSRLAVQPDARGGYLIRFDGAPDVTYDLQRAASVTGPWDTIAMLAAPATGQIEFHDTTSPPGQAFYRTVQP